MLTCDADAFSGDCGVCCCNYSGTKLSIDDLFYCRAFGANSSSPPTLCTFLVGEMSFLDALWSWAVDSTWPTLGNC